MSKFELLSARVDELLGEKRRVTSENIGELFLLAEGMGFECAQEESLGEDYRPILFNADLGREVFRSRERAVVESMLLLLSAFA